MQRIMSNDEIETRATAFRASITLRRPVSARYPSGPVMSVAHVAKNTLGWVAVGILTADERETLLRLVAAE